MIDMLTLSIGIGLVMSLIFSEMFGFKAGGMVVPGYIALYLTHPVDVLLTLAVAFGTFLTIRLLASIIIIYGKRRTVLCVLIGFVLGAIVRIGIGSPMEIIPIAEYSVIGYIIPGLIAIWIDRQGTIETLSPLLTVAVLIRLILILTVPNELQTLELQLTQSGSISIFKQAFE